MDHKFYFERKFYQDKKTGYWISTTYPRIRAHAWVWKYHHGAVGNGFHVHHIDGDKSNNEISNLEVLNVKDHVARHFSEERRERNIQHAAKIRPLTKEWHASAAGLEWHKTNGIQAWEKRCEFEIKCKNCGAKSHTKTYHQDFCSNKCKSTNRRKSGLDDIERQCAVCENKFKVNRYAKTKTCGKDCGCILRSKKYRGV